MNAPLEGKLLEVQTSEHVKGGVKMRRLKSLCNFLIGLFTGLATTFFIKAIIRHNINLLLIALIMATICVVIIYNVTKAEKEENMSSSRKKGDK